MSNKEKWMTGICRFISVFSFLNFLFFFYLSIYLGGDALNGRMENDKYYLNNHGTYTEVGKDVWTLNRMHGISVFVTFPLGMICQNYVWKKRKKTYTLLK